MRLIKVREALSNVIMIMGCFIMSVLLCMKIFDRFFMRISSSNVGFMGLRIFLAVILFITIKFVLNKRLSNMEINFAFITYFLLIISLTLFKIKDLTAVTGYNLNLLSIFEDFSTTRGTFMTIGNLFAYAPIAFYIKNKFKITPYRFLIIVFIMYCVGLELIQYIFRLGIFDINDVVLNALGSILGLYLYWLYEKNKNTKREYEKN